MKVRNISIPDAFVRMARRGAQAGVGYWSLAGTDSPQAVACALSNFYEAASGNCCMCEQPTPCAFWLSPTAPLHGWLHITCGGIVKMEHTRWALWTEAEL
jgi:hypothetical protein